MGLSGGTARGAAVVRAVGVCAVRVGAVGVGAVLLVACRDAPTSSVTAPGSAHAPTDGPVPVLRAEPPAGPAIEVRLDTVSVGHLAVADLRGPVPLASLLPATTPDPDAWHAISAQRSDAHTFSLAEPVSALHGALPYVRPAADGTVDLYFQRVPAAGLPDHVARLAAAPTHVVSGVRSLQVATVAPEPEHTPATPLTLTTPDGTAHPVPDALLATLPVGTDPERPDRETGNWHRLDDLVRALAPDAAARPHGLRVVEVGGAVTELRPSAVAELTLLLKRNQKGHVVLRGWRDGTASPERVVSIAQVEALTVRSVGTPAP